MSNDTRPSKDDKETRSPEEHHARRLREQALKPPLERPLDGETPGEPNAVLECGWGRLIFGHTFKENARLREVLRDERPTRRDIAIYIRDPHVLLANAPLELFLDPSHTYRLDLATYRPAEQTPDGFFIRRLTALSDAEEINRIYALRGLVPVPSDFFWRQRDARTISYLVAEDNVTGAVLGTVMGVDHHHAFNDPEHGSSLWCLAVDPQARQPGIGEALVRRLAEQYKARGAAYLDLSVMHDNEQAIALYEKLGFERIQFFNIKRKNPINEKLFIGSDLEASLNPYSKIIVKEARRRGIHFEVTDAENNYFRLSFGGRTIHCRESLTELTTAIAMSICDDKSAARRIVKEAGVKTPAQMEIGEDRSEAVDFLKAQKRVVVKPCQGEQGRGISVGVDNEADLETAIEEARKVSNRVLLEEYFEGVDLRLVVIDFRVVAAAMRSPPKVFGDGVRDIKTLIENQSRRRAAATEGESKIPIDDDTIRTVAEEGYELSDVLEKEKELVVRKTANLHTGGTIHDVTDEVHNALLEAAVKVARAIDIPVVGVDFMVTSARAPEYIFIEANERPGLANHEPQPTAERFMDLLFPLSIAEADKKALRKPKSGHP